MIKAKKTKKTNPPDSPNTSNRPGLERGGSSENIKLMTTNQGSKNPKEQMAGGPGGNRNSGKNLLSLPSAVTKKKASPKKSGIYFMKSKKYDTEEVLSSSEYQAKSTSDATILSALTTNSGSENNPREKEMLDTKVVENTKHQREDDIIVIADETQ